MGESNRIVFWGNKEGGKTDIWSCKDFRRNQNFESGSQNIFEESDSKRIKLSPANLQDVNFDNSVRSRPLGLKLRKSNSLLDLVHQRLYKGKQAKIGDDKPKLNVDQLRSPDKVKAVNFPAVSIKIGSWQRVCTHGGDLVAKVYYAKHKMVWEVLEGALKSKIEIQWSDITAIRASFDHNQQEILEIELKQPPLFYQEINPQPRKHTLWQQSSDFTGGQASIYRRHFAVFPPRSFSHHYEKLLQCDSRLLALSKKQFPGQESPFCDSVIYRNLQIPTNFNGYQNLSAIARGTLFGTTPNSTLPVMDWPHGNGRGRGYRLVNHIGNASIQRPLYITSPTQGNEVFLSQDYQSNGIVLNDIHNNLPSYSQVACSNDRTPAKVEPMVHSNLDPMYINNNNISMQIEMNYQNIGTSQVGAYQITGTDQVGQNADENNDILDTLLHSGYV